jgi:hypothetical protein
MLRKPDCGRGVVPGIMAAIFAPSTAKDGFAIPVNVPRHPYTRFDEEGIRVIAGLWDRVVKGVPEKSRVR